MGHIKNKSNWSTANTRVETAFELLFRPKITGTWQRFMRVIPAQTQTVDLVFGQFLGAVREWIGAKQFNPIQAYHQLFLFRKWENSLALSRPDVEYDPNGLIKGRIDDFMYDQSQWYDKIFHDLMFSNSGAGPIGYDGVALFSASHTDGFAGATWSNTTTSALSFASFDAALQTIKSYRKFNGEPLGMVPRVLVVGPKLFKIAKEVAEAEWRGRSIDAAGAEGVASQIAVSTIPNVLSGIVEVVEDARYIGTQDDYWTILSSNGNDSITPFVGIEQRAPELVAMTAMDGTMRFMNDELAWSIEADFSPGAGAPQAIYQGIVA